MTPNEASIALVKYNGFEAGYNGRNILLFHLDPAQSDSLKDINFYPLDQHRQDIVYKIWTVFEGEIFSTD